MYVQTNEEGRITAISEHDDIKNGFQFELPEGFDLDNMYEYIIKDGKIFFDESIESLHYKIYDLKDKLHETDYISSKFTDQLLSCKTITDIFDLTKHFRDQYHTTIEERQKWRNSINELNNLIKLKGKSNG